MTDRMVLIAIIYSRSEAMIVASMLESAGILVHIGGYHHASVSVCQLGLGGFRLTVPEFQVADASRLITTTPGFGEHVFSYALQRATIKVIIIWIAIFGLPINAAAVISGIASPWQLFLTPLTALTIPANPQGNGEYFLVEPETG